MTEMRSVLDPRYDAAYEDRIRELEAAWTELQRQFEASCRREDEWKARAEKAEARVAELERIQANMTWNEEAREREAD